MAFDLDVVERRITYRGQTFTAVFGMATIARFEIETGQSMPKVLSEGNGIPFYLLGELLRAALAEHHPDLTREHAMQLAASPDGQAALSSGLTSAMPQAGDTGEDGEPASENPPKAAAKSRSGGKTG
jgi:hypothetical protein